MKRMRILLAASVCLALFVTFALLFAADPAALAAPPTPDSGAKFQTVGNPAARYCSELLGYEYRIVNHPDGSQTGECVLPDRQTCDGWDFYAGSCGAEFSWCAHEGLLSETRSDGKDPFSNPYQVCIDPTSRQAKTISEILVEQDTRVPALPPIPSADMPRVGPQLLDAAPAAYPPPASFDWRNNGGDWTTPVKNQGACGSCWAFSAIGVAESHLERKSNNALLNPDLSEEYLVSDCVVNDCDGGHSWSSLSYIRDVGVVNETCMPYTHASVPSGSNALCSYCASPTWSRVDGAIFGWNDWGSRDNLIQAILNHGPVSVSFNTQGMVSDPVSGIFSCPDPQTEWYGHAVVAVGYQEPVAGQPGYWILKNSWGANWGPASDGYFMLEWGQCELEDQGFTYAPVFNARAQLPAVLRNSGPALPAPQLIAPGVDISQIDSGIPEINTLKPLVYWAPRTIPNVDVAWVDVQISQDEHLHDASASQYQSGLANESSDFMAWDNLKPGAVYYAQAVTTAWLNEIRQSSKPSNTLVFRTSSTGTFHGSVSLTSPTNGATVSSPVVLNWTSTTNVDQYYLIITYLHPRYQTRFGYLRFPSNNYDVVDFLEPGITYYWSVRGENAFAYGPWSEERSFTLPAAAAAPAFSAEAAAQPPPGTVQMVLEDGHWVPLEQYQLTHPDATR